VSHITIDADELARLITLARQVMQRGPNTPGACLLYHRLHALAQKAAPVVSAVTATEDVPDRLSDDPALVPVYDAPAPF